MRDPHSKYLGHWYGTTTTPPAMSFSHFTSLVILGIDKDHGSSDIEFSTQQPSSPFTTSSRTYHLCLQSKYYAQRPIRPIIWSRDSDSHSSNSASFTCTLPHWAFTYPVHVHGTFLPSPSGPILHLTFSGSIFNSENFTLSLQNSNHLDPRHQKYLHPAPSLSYVYRVPTVSPTDEDYFSPADAASAGLCVPDLEAVVNSLLRLDTGQQGDPRCDGILVLKDGRLVLEEYFWGLEKEDAHEISSCTKSVAAILVGIAFDQGLLDVEDVVSEAWPNVDTTWGEGGDDDGEGNSPWKEPVRLRHLLSMCTGTAVWEPKEGDDGLVEPGFLVSTATAEDVLSFPRTSPPGAVWNYDNSLPFLTACYLEKKTGMSVEAFADAYLFEPLGIPPDLRRWTYLRQRTFDGTKAAVMLSGGLYLRLRDLAKVGQMMLDGGVYGGKRIISESWVGMMTARCTKEGQWPYGLGWHLNPTEDQRHLDGEGYLALGQGEQVVAVLPGAGLVVCWMSSTWVNRMGYRIAMKEINDKWIKKIKV